MLICKSLILLVYSHSKWFIKMQYKVPKELMMFALYIDLSQEEQLLQFYDKFVQYNSDFIKAFITSFDELFNNSFSSLGKLQSKDKLHLTIGLWNNNEQQKLNKAISVVKNLSDDFFINCKSPLALSFQLMEHNEYVYAVLAVNESDKQLFAPIWFKSYNSADLSILSENIDYIFDLNDKNTVVHITLMKFDKQFFVRNVHCFTDFINRTNEILLRNNISVGLSFDKNKLISLLKWKQIK